MGGGNPPDKSIGELLSAARPSPPRALPRRLRENSLLDERIAVRRQLGAGATSTAYEAEQAGKRIALKVLNNLDPGQIYALKKEFRVLRRLRHPNVVSVHELFCLEDQWFFTMELIDGLPLDRHWTERVLHHSTPQQAELALRGLIAQLAQGVNAIHRAGLLHRDLKPSNVLVEASGRLVILDFGLVSDQQGEGGVGQTLQHVVSGTPGYMAPEQAAGRGAQTASDWYAVGGIIFQLLTGRLPFQGTSFDVIREKQLRCAPSAREFAHDVADDLIELCDTLLARAPEARFDEQRIAQLAAHYRPLRDEPRAPTSGLPFVGRRFLLSELESAYLSARVSGPTLSLVSGPFGSGKTALLERFSEHIQQRDHVLVLRGRCQERESVPHKAFDECVDNLSRMLMRLTQEQAAQLVPRYPEALIRLFPVLSRVGALREAAKGAEDTEQTLDLRRRGVMAFRELLCRIADRRPLVLIIDDLQWCDADSERLFAELFLPPDAPRMFVLSCFRSEGSTVPASVARLLALEEVSHRSYALEPMSRDESYELASAALAQGDPLPGDVARAIAGEAQGVPLYVLELAQQARLLPEQESALSLDDLFRRRTKQLDATASRWVQILAIAGRPLSLSVLNSLTPAPDPHGTLALLEEQTLARVRTAQGEPLVELLHDGVARSALGELEADAVRAIHRELAELYKASKDANPAIIAEHLHGAGDPDDAQRYLTDAAAQAMEALAYHRARELLELAQARARRPSAALLERLGDARVASGQAPEAAREYLRAAEHAAPQKRHALRLRAASQLLRSGQVGEGSELLRSVLSNEGVTWPRNMQEALALLLVNRARIRLRGLRFQVREEHEVPRSLLDKLDALYPAQTVLGTFDYLRGACYAAMALPLALRAGEPSRLCTSLTAEAVYRAMIDGIHGHDSAQEVRAIIDRLARHMDLPYGYALTYLGHSLCAYWEGRWDQVEAPALRAEAYFRGQVTGGTWEANLVRSVRHTVVLHNGQLPRAAIDVPSSLHDVRDSHDLYARFDLQRIMLVIHLMHDRVAEAREELRTIEQLIKDFPIVSVHHLFMAATVSFHLYAGEIQIAQARLDELWERCKSVSLHRFPLLRAAHLGMQADCTAADRQRPVGKRAKTLLQLAKAAEAEPVRVGQALGQSIRASAAELGDQAETAVSLWMRAAELYESEGMRLDAALARYRVSSLVKSNWSRELRSDAEQFLSQQGIAAPERWAMITRSLF
jgi:serine/threonine protein kinase